MGAKASTANGGQSPRARTFSTSSSSDVVSGGAGFSLLRAIPGIQVSNDRQRARSLSSVPDLHASHEAIAIPPNSQSYEASAAASPDTDSSSNEEAGPVAGTSLALGRVYAAHSLPSHIWSLNGKSLVVRESSDKQDVLTMYRRRYRTTLGLGLGSSLSSTFSTTLSFSSRTSTIDSVRSDARATAAKLKSKYENAGTAQGLCVRVLCLSY
ncbi:unnamed protein product [Euphydryas editha]|uniref:Uncharacterized protein n=1 Tax=Euphydryas editha TaxID=104508 RepID=A0AAU9TVB4_EUPED|nr:unnamed protein product [Euphydryas editha]